MYRFLSIILINPCKKLIMAEFNKFSKIVIISNDARFNFKLSCKINYSRYILSNEMRKIK